MFMLNQWGTIIIIVIAIIIIIIIISYSFQIKKLKSGLRSFKRQMLLFPYNLIAKKERLNMLKIKKLFKRFPGVITMKHFS